MNKLLLAKGNPPRKVRSQVQTPRNMKTIVVALCLLVVLISVSVVLVSTSLNAETTPRVTSTPLTTYHATTQLQIVISYNRHWNATWGSGTDTGIAIEGESIIGIGQKTITVTRPNTSDPCWVVTAVAAITSNPIQNGSTGDILTVSILKMDGTELESTSTSNPNELAQVYANIVD